MRQSYHPAAFAGDEPKVRPGKTRAAAGRSRACQECGQGRESYALSGWRKCLVSTLIGGVHGVESVVSDSQLYHINAMLLLARPWWGHRRRSSFLPKANNNLGCSRAGRKQRSSQRQGQLHSSHRHDNWSREILCPASITSQALRGGDFPPLAHHPPSTPTQPCKTLPTLALSGRGRFRTPTAAPRTSPSTSSLSIGRIPAASEPSTWTRSGKASRMATSRPTQKWVMAKMGTKSRMHLLRKTR